MTPVLPKDVVSRIKEETDIVGLVREYVTLKASGTSFKGLCPFHREKTPSFHINPQRQIYKCFGCGEGGDAISFLMKLQGLSFPEALEVLARPLNIDLSRFLVDNDETEGERQAFFRAQETAAALWSDALWDASGAGARTYLSDRGFSEEILRRYDVGFAPGATSWLRSGLQRQGVDTDLARRAGLLRKGRRDELFAYYRNRIIFPIRNIAQRIAGFGGRILGDGEPKYLNSAESDYFNKRELLYGFSLSRIPIARSKTAILVEGYLDQIALAQAGFSNSVATCGTAFTTQQARALRRGCRTVYVLFDGDAAGLKAAVKTAGMGVAEGLEVRIARMPEGEDPASFLQENTAQALAGLLEAAPGYLPLLHDLAAGSGLGRAGMERAVKTGLQAIAQINDPIRQAYLVAEASDLFHLDGNILRAEIDRLNNTRRYTDVEQQPAVPVGGIDGPAATAARRRSDLNAEAIAAQMLAHALCDASGRAVETMLARLEGVRLASETGEALRGDLESWRKARAGGEAVAPAAFVQARWHDRDDRYRRFVTDLLTGLEVIDEVDHERVVRDCLDRLESDQERRRLSEALRTRTVGEGD
ncbi:DNA primase [bacterium]|nr:DNA primase [bacterium]MBU1674863.1 DNA primase [bacterium]